MLTLIVVSNTIFLVLLQARGQESRLEAYENYN